jgi:chromosome segregation ATPase
MSDPQQVHKLQAQVQQLTQLLDAAYEENKQCEEKYNTLKSTVKHLNVQLENAKFHIDCLTNKIEEKDHELMIKTIEISELSTPPAAAAGAQSDLKAEIDSLRAQLRTCEDGSDFFNRELQKLRTETARQKTEADEYHRAAMNKLRDELTTVINDEKARFAHYEDLCKKLQSELLTMWCNERGYNEDKKKDKQKELNAIKEMLSYFKTHFSDQEFRKGIVKKMFNQVLLKYHPDKNGDEQVFKALGSAWDEFVK